MKALNQDKTDAVVDISIDRTPTPKNPKINPAILKAIN